MYCPVHVCTKHVIMQACYTCMESEFLDWYFMNHLYLEGICYITEVKITYLSKLLAKKVIT